MHEELIVSSVLRIQGLNQDLLGSVHDSDTELAEAISGVLEAIGADL